MHTIWTAVLQSQMAFAAIMGPVTSDQTIPGSVALASLVPWNLVVFLGQSYDRYMNAYACRDACRSRPQTRSGRAAGFNSTCGACRTLFPLSPNDPEIV